MIIIPKNEKTANIFVPKPNNGGGNIEIKDTGKLQDKDLVITENGEYVIKCDEGYYALNEIIIKVNVK